MNTTLQASPTQSNDIIPADRRAASRVSHKNSGVVEVTDEELIAQFVNDVRRSDFEQWLTDWRGRTKQRTFESNVVEVIVNFRVGWVEICDVLAADHTVRLDSIEAAVDMLPLASGRADSAQLPLGRWTTTATSGQSAPVV